uniref:F-box domain-containing protein n=1 Tax=Chlamydomonas euryale TaxID=1486919 RepID=A0A7R9VLT4_9CHLO|mmetsp:Transcript_39326/g.116997  ORF Transcript_39326/g.116997 Transcript_39326/m.116997 type:complete len:402 (+) Transcript_39326:103-1308(+)
MNDSEQQHEFDGDANVLAFSDALLNDHTVNEGREDDMAICDIQDVHRHPSSSKRQRLSKHGAVPSLSRCVAVTAYTSSEIQSECDLLQLPAEVLELVLSRLEAATLVILQRCCKAFRSRDRSTGLTLADKVARDQLIRWHGPQLAERWRHCTWLERLHIDQAVTLFDRPRCEKQGFVFTCESSSPASGALEATSAVGQAPPHSCGRVSGVKLDGIGPKLLVSDAVLGTDTPLLRWRLELKGNNAVEFGTIPISLQDQPKALHKCATGSDGDRPSGFCSAITVGSMLPVKLPLMRGSIVEILASKGRLRYTVSNPPNGMEMTWQNTVTVPKPYKGPLEFRFEQDLPSGQPVKLAVTCWARAAFNVLHTQHSSHDANAAAPRDGDIGGRETSPEPPLDFPAPL